jgi:hypothetical protein
MQIKKAGGKETDEEIARLNNAQKFVSDMMTLKSDTEQIYVFPNTNRGAFPKISFHVGDGYALLQRIMLRNLEQFSDKDIELYTEMRGLFEPAANGKALVLQ